MKMCNLIGRALALAATRPTGGAESLAEADADRESWEPMAPLHWSDPDAPAEPHPDDEPQIFDCPCGSVIQVYRDESLARADAWCDQHAPTAPRSARCSAHTRPTRPASPRPGRDLVPDTENQPPAGCGVGDRTTAELLRVAASLLSRGNPHFGAELRNRAAEFDAIGEDRLDRLVDAAIARHPSTHVPK